MNKWFEKVAKYRSYQKAADRFNLSLEFFEALEWKNPFSNSSLNFKDLSFNARGQVIKVSKNEIVSLHTERA